MPLKTLVVCCLFICISATAHAATFDLGAKGKLTVAVPPAWAADTPADGSEGFDVLIRPRLQPKAQINVTVIPIAQSAALDRAAAENAFRQIADQAAVDSVEKTATICELTLSNGFGFYASFTEVSPASVETDVEKWKTSTPCMMVLGTSVVVVTIFSDDLASSDFANALAILQSVEFQPAG